MGILDGLLGMLGGQGQQQPAQQQQQQHGPSPLAQALMAAYFKGLQTPKLSGWGAAMGQGGQAGMNAFNNATYQQQLAQQAQMQNQLSSKRLDLEGQQLETEKARTPYYAAQAQAMQAKTKEAEAGELFYRPEDNTAIRVKPGEVPPPGYLPEDVFKSRMTSSPEAKANVAKATAEARKAVNAEEPIGTDQHFMYLDPQSLAESQDQKISRKDALDQGLKPVTRKEGESINSLLNARELVASMKESSKDVFYKNSDIGITGTYGTSAGMKADKLYNPERYSKYDADVAALAGLPRTLLGGSRMNLTEWNAIMDKISGGKGYTGTQESVATALDEADKQIVKKLQHYSSKYGTADAGQPDSPEGQPDKSAQPDSSSDGGFINVPGLGRVKRNN